MPDLALDVTDWRSLDRLQDDARLTDASLVKQAERPRAATKRKRR